MCVDTTTVSVVIPFFNAGRFLEETLASVLGQTFQKFEVILVNDGSTDASSNIACRFAETHSERARLCRHDGGQNRGTSATRNLGLRYARGEWVIFLDADDVWQPHLLDHYVALATRNKVVHVIYGPGKWWKSWPGCDLGHESDYLQDLCVPLNVVVQPPELVKRFLENEQAVPLPSGTLIRRRILTEYGSWEDDFTGMYDDQVLFTKLGLTCQVYATSKNLFWYRQHGDSLCAQAGQKGSAKAERKRFLLWMLTHIQSTVSNETEVRPILERELLRLALY